VIVAVNGACAGGGLHFVADADIALAGDRASFLDPHVSVGHVSALEPLTLFFRARRDVLARLALLGAGEQLGAEEARDAGLVSEVVPAERLLARSVELAERVAANSPTAVRRTRRVLREFQECLLGDALDTGWRMIRDHWEHPDALEGPAAFLERREPRWVEP
jgi:enoyl-CoA hydratase/carnithine racemase